MKLVLRRIGNSLGVILPRSALRAWQLDEGDFLEMTERGIRPLRYSESSHQFLDDHKRNLAVSIAARFSPLLIRAHSLANLHRWRKSGAWVSAYGDWQKILESGSDGELFAVMLGRDEEANRLRQSPPYVGLLPRDEVRRLNEEAAA